MGNIEIKSHELQNRICAAPEVNKFDFTDVTPEDLKSVKRLFLPGTKFNGEPTDVRLAELGAVSNLEELTLNSFVIDDRINSILAMLPNLKALEFTNCDFRDCTEINTVKPLDFFGINIGENVEGKRFPRAMRVHVNNTSVSFDSIEWDDLKVAKFHNSTLHGVSRLDGKDGKTCESVKNDLKNYSKDFYPTCNIDKINVYFLTLKHSKTNKVMSDLYVIKIIVMPGEPYNLYSINNKGGYISALRLPGQCINLTGEEILTELMKRTNL